MCLGVQVGQIISGRDVSDFLLGLDHQMLLPTRVGV